MAFKPGHKRIGGRKAGTPNKRTQTLIERAEALGVDPFEILLHFAGGNWMALGYKSESVPIMTRSGSVVSVSVISPADRRAAAAEACQYMHPKRKAIELAGQGGGPLEVYLRMSPEERAKRREELEHRLGFTPKK